MIRFGLIAIVSSFIFSCSAPSNSDPITGAISGEKVYGNYCVSCHGLNGENKVANKLILRESTSSDTLLRSRITYGAGNGMPAYKNMLTTEEIEAVLAYIKQLRNY